MFQVYFKCLFLFSRVKARALTCILHIFRAKSKMKIAYLNLITEEYKIQPYHRGQGLPREIPCSLICVLFLFVL